MGKVGDGIEDKHSNIESAVRALKKHPTVSLCVDVDGDDRRDVYLHGIDNDVDGNVDGLSLDRSLIKLNYVKRN